MYSSQKNSKNHWNVNYSGGREKELFWGGGCNVLECSAFSDPKVRFQFVFAHLLNISLVRLQEDVISIDRLLRWNRLDQPSPRRSSCRLPPPANFKQ